jgi:hypothetical protein
MEFVLIKKLVKKEHVLPVSVKNVLRKKVRLPAIKMVFVLVLIVQVIPIRRDAVGQMVENGNVLYIRTNAFVSAKMKTALVVQEDVKNAISLNNLLYQIIGVFV